MAVDMFLKLDGIAGESQDSQHKDEIEVLSFSWGVSQTIDRASGGGGGSGKASFQDLHFESLFSKASPDLFVSCAAGKHISSGVLSVRKSGDQKGGVDYLKITFSDVLVSSYQSAGGGDNPNDTISLNFAKIEVDYSATSADGSVVPAVQASWDVLKNAQG